MMIRSNRIAAAVVLASALTLTAFGADAANYTFSQGFSGEGIVTGSFTGVDLNSDDVLDASYGEISNFFLSFSGQGINQGINFTLTQTQGDLVGLVWDMRKDAFIGNDTVVNAQGTVSTVEGIVASSSSNDFMYLTGIGPNTELLGDRTSNGGTILNTGAILTRTTEMVSVSAAPVPEPETWAMLLVGLGLVAIVSRRRGKDIAIW
jgi:hypothetical protein